MTPVCSILIPTRGRVERLTKTIASFMATASQCDYEILLRVDSDDADLFRYFELLKTHQNIRILEGSRGRGWPDNHLFFTELAKIAVAPWCWNFNDDATVEGQGWVEQLKAIPTIGTIVQPETHKLNTSVYHNNQSGPFPIVPTRVWEKFGYMTCPFPQDTALDQILRVNNRWETVYLKGITVWHERDNDSRLMDVRKI